MQRHTPIFAFLIAACVLLNADGVLSQNAAQRAAQAVSSLNGWYNTGNGQWDTTGWWNSANALTAVVHFSTRTNNHTYDSTVIANTFSKHSSFLNDYYDDEGWWGLAWVEAYKFTKNNNYLSMAEKIFSDIAASWDTHCNGGVWWDRKRSYKNAIANELFFQLGSALYIQTNNQQYLDWANKEWAWFKGTGMINGDNMINDGLTNDCKNNGQTAWTYNQGVILGALVNMYQITRDSAYLNQATAIADAAIAKLVTSQGILREPCEPNCGGDGPQFKGVFTRNLGYLYLQTRNTKYSAFISKNADSIWNNNRNGNHLGLIWSGPFDSADAARQSSALDTLNAALL